MVVLRNQLASKRAGGPRQFAELRNIIMVSVEPGSERDAESELDSIGLRSNVLSNAPVIIAEPSNTIEDVLDRMSDRLDEADQAIQDIQEAGEEEEGFVESTTAAIRATAGLVEFISEMSPIRTAGFSHSFADFGPENLRLSPIDMPTVLAAEDREDTLDSVLRDMNIEDAWEVTRGEGATVAIFDTGFAQDLIDSSRVQSTFHGGGTTSAYASSEGHGTMCVGAAAANSDEGVPFSGVAPDADVLLVRITGEDGQIRSDLIAEGWDWLINRAGDQPIVSNHSYGTPICSSVRRPQFCNDPVSDVIRVANSTTDITSTYAAGNEAMYCGHRPSGLTNGVTAHNSLNDVVTVGALLSDGREAQKYSSHGRGDCSPRADPKPNVSMRIPVISYYGVEGGWEAKNMSSGVIGSSGGTSHASPMICGALALLQSAAPEPLSTEEIKQVIVENSEAPHPTQINQFGFLLGQRGWDARFGYGELDIASAVQSVSG